MQYILIADDNADITDVLEAYVRKEGYEPLVAADGEEALRLFRLHEPAAVLLDVMMPKELRGVPEDSGGFGYTGDSDYGQR